jgi:aminoglycoside phosphotransferase (APT) family kinase protein
MSSEASEQMMALLRQLAVLKAIDSAGRPRTSEEKSARRERQRHRDQLRQQIKEVARTKKQTL